jgi:hypothetical protein
MTKKAGMLAEALIVIVLIMSASALVFYSVKASVAVKKW